VSKGERKTEGAPPDRGPLIIGHRGASGHAPENTHAAFALAFEQGADGVEFDVRLARDGVPFVFHDEACERILGIYGAIDRFESETLGHFHVGHWFNERYPHRAHYAYEWGEKIPMLAEVFERYGAHTLYAEMKCEDVSRRPELARAVVELIRKHGLAARVVVKSFALDSLREVKRLAPEVRTAALFGRSWPRPFPSAARIIAEAEACGADEISLHRSLLREATVREAKRRGFDVLVWTVNSRGALRRAFKLELKAVFTDFPGRMRDALTRLRAEKG
jgi:glycerophosphoryl diester phosphodiesterase